MYDTKDIIHGIQEPRKLFREVNRLIHTRAGRYEYNPNGSGIFEKDWDHLIILDACRHDAFCEVSELPGKTSYRYSLAPATYQFIPANFSNKHLLDTIYIGANNWYLQLKDQINSEVYRFVDLRDDDANVEWAIEDLNIPTPESVTQRTLELSDQHPNKRFIIHYLQPHHPFIGKKGQNYSEKNSTSLIDVVKSSNKSDKFLREAYYENLKLVINEVDTLLTELDGRIGITSDHGEMLGDRHQYVPVQDYGHHPGIFNNPTVKVPWHIYEQGKRPTFREDEPVRSSDIDENKVTQQLKNLGYKL